LKDDSKKSCTFSALFLRQIFPTSVLGAAQQISNIASPLNFENYRMKVACAETLIKSIWLSACLLNANYFAGHVGKIIYKNCICIRSVL
jgi:hypothetical protein